MRYGKQTKHRMTDFFDALKSLPTVYDERLMDLEARLFEDDCDQNYYSKKRSEHKKSFNLDMDRLKDLCSQPLTWQEIADELGETKARVRDFARAQKIEKVRTPAGKKKSGTALTNMENVTRYYERHSPPAEELDRLMVLYGGYIGLLAFKLDKSLPMAKSILRYRGRYKTWMEYFKNGGKYDFFNK